MRFAHRGRLCSVILVCLLLSSVRAHAAHREITQKLSREPAEEDLAAALSSLKSDDERSALLTAEKELVTKRLVQELIKQGNSSKLQGNYAEALDRFRLAQKIAEQINDQAGFATTLNSIGSICSNQGKYAQALELYQKSLALFEALGDKAGIASAVRGIGIVHFSQSDYTQALEHFQKSLALFEAVGDKVGIARSLSNIGTTQFSLNNYAQALEYYQKSLAVSEGAGDKQGVRSALGNIGNVYNRQGNFTQALEIYQKSLVLYEAAGDKVWIARTLNNMGSIYEGQGNDAQALVYYQKSLKQIEALGDKVSMNLPLHNLGSVYSDQGNYAQALEYFQKALALRETLGNKSEIADTLGGIGCVYFSQGNYAQALEYFQRALALREGSAEKDKLSLTLSNIAGVYKQQGNYAQALEQYQKSLTISEAIGDKLGVLRSLHSIGTVYKHQGNYALALEYLQKSLALSQAVGDKVADTDTLIDLGTVSRLQGQHAQALDFARRATALAKQFGYSNLFWHAQNLEGLSYRDLNQLIPARQAFEEAIATIETLRTQVAGGEQDKQRFFEGRFDPYHAMVELLVDQKQFSAALGYAERAKARVLLDVLHSGRIDITKAMSAAELDQEHGFSDQIVSLNTQISRENRKAQPDPARLNDLKTQLQKLRLDYEAFQTGLYAAHPELKTQRGEIEALTPEQARALLPDSRSALLEYVVADERAYLFALTLNAAGTTTELKVYPLAIKQTELEDRVARFRETLANGSPGFRQPARELYDLLLKPAAAQLQGRTALVIVPDGSLWELPFQTLQSGPNRYLIEDSAIAYAPSLTALREMNKLRDRKKNAASPTLLAFGNPAFGQESIARNKPVLMDAKFEPLPEAERQVDEIKQIYGAAKTKVYIGAEATESHAKAEAGSYRILHLATHGILNNSSPMYSYLLLAQSEGDSNEDGLLEAWEIMKLNLNADLVVLSACETARGRVGTGEGMIGLSWALFIAGSPTSILSQWKVDSASTTELMVEFHRQLKAQMTKPADSFSAARALREADLKLLRNEQYRHPFYWAGFVVTGKGF